MVTRKIKASEISTDHSIVIGPFGYRVISVVHQENGRIAVQIEEGTQDFFDADDLIRVATTAREIIDIERAAGILYTPGDALCGCPVYFVTDGKTSEYMGTGERVTVHNVNCGL